MKIIQTSRGRGALAVTLGALVFACLPWQSTITAPAILRPAQQSEIYPLEAARIERIYVHNGQNVRAGEPLAVLHSDALDNEHRLAELQLALIEAQLARRAADTQDRSASSVLLGARKRELATLAGLEKSRKALIVRAPHDGVVSGLEDALHTGRTLGPKDRIARIIGPQNFEIIAFPHEDDAARLADSSRLIFIPDDILSPKFSAAITTFAPTSETHLTEDILSSQYRGPLAVSENVRGLFVPNTAIFRITASVDNAPNSLRAVRGVAKIKGKAQSPIKRFGARIGQVLIREADF